MLVVKGTCIRCGKESQWNSDDDHTIIIEFDGWQLGLMIYNPPNTWNGGIPCRDCLIRAITPGSYRYTDHEEQEILDANELKQYLQKVKRANR